jgi:hypothetical protein
LIVDTKGTYQAAITRKVTTKIETEIVHQEVSYEFFGEGSVKKPFSVATSPEISEKTIIEYFMLDVQREETDNPLDYLDRRFEEIEEQKRKSVINNTNTGRLIQSLPSPKWNGDGALVKSPGSDYDIDDMNFKEWLNRPKDPEPPKVKEPTLFGEEEMDELVDITKWQPDPTIIHYLVCQLLCCSLIVNKDIDIKQWVNKFMIKKYDEIFGDAHGIEFGNWSESYIEFIIGHYSDSNAPEVIYDDWDLYQSRIAEALSNELSEYPENDYLAQYKEVLIRYIYE